MLFAGCVFVLKFYLKEKEKNEEEEEEEAKFAS
jgi:hypothetical protein